MGNPTTRRAFLAGVCAAGIPLYVSACSSFFSIPDDETMIRLCEGVLEDFAVHAASTAEEMMQIASNAGLNTTREQFSEELRDTLESNLSKFNASPGVIPFPSVNLRQVSVSKRLSSAKIQADCGCCSGPAPIEVTLLRKERKGEVKWVNLYRS